ncbi:aspartyl/asparaginyl beta-hydroxylase domain-containing protein [Sphingomonas sp.]|uniref:aspartyl/asparaginyl beta-hydroxylase domain-containing protein n=1 Tax=Sphingomonas sp. TaxID=28214 RepID=UPI00286B1620|nr:aspartyl/asparaginyl beta-hydroxylase domain-containing protein [Sphingomonas sp.]
MRLTQPFLRLPLTFCAETLAAEVQALPGSAWVLHPNKFPGNEAVRLVTPDGRQTDDFHGAMKPTEYLVRCPYIMEVMAELGGIWGRSRLMGLAAGTEVPPHVDAHYHWHTHLRIHVPVITNPGVEFICGDQSAHMAPGECWTFDSFRWHEVHNRGSEQRVHLVLDTVITGRLWDLLDAAQSGTTTAAMDVRPGSGSGQPLVFEQHNAPEVMTAWEIRCHVDFIASEALPHPKLATALKVLDRFTDCWAALWAQFGTAGSALPLYRTLAEETRQALRTLGASEILLRNELEFTLVVDQLVFVNAVPAAPQQPTGAVTSNLAARRLAS